MVQDQRQVSSAFNKLLKNPLLTPVSDLTVTRAKAEIIQVA